MKYLCQSKSLETENLERTPSLLVWLGCRARCCATVLFCSNLYVFTARSDELFADFNRLLSLPFAVTLSTPRLAGFLKAIDVGLFETFASNQKKPRLILELGRRQI